MPARSIAPTWRGVSVANELNVTTVPRLAARSSSDSSASASGQCARSASRSRPGRGPADPRGARSVPGDSTSSTCRKRAAASARPSLDVPDQAGPRTNRIGRVRRIIRATASWRCLRDARLYGSASSCGAGEGGTPRRPARESPSRTGAGLARYGFFGCFGFFGSLRCLSRLPMDGLVGGRDADADAPPGCGVSPAGESCQKPAGVGVAGAYPRSGGPRGVRLVSRCSTGIAAAWRIRRRGARSAPRGRPARAARRPGRPRIWAAAPRRRRRR